MDINAAAHMLFGVDYEKLSDMQAEETHDFRDLLERVAFEETWE